MIVLRCNSSGTSSKTYFNIQKHTKTVIFRCCKVLQTCFSTCSEKAQHVATCGQHFFTYETTYLNHSFRMFSPHVF